MFRKRLQLGLLHVAVTMTLVPINSTLNRVMIKELALSAALVATLASLPFLFSPLQVAIGSFSDRYPLFGWRRTPYIVLGLLLCVAGVWVAPRAAFLLADNFWGGLAAGALAFGAWGMGYNFASVAYFALASEISGEEGRTRTIAIMFFMMILSIIFTSLALSRLLETYSPENLERAFRLVGGAALALGMLGILGLEARTGKREAEEAERYSWREIANTLTGNRQVVLFFFYMVLLLAAILGQDILLEPFGAEAFGLPVNATTLITTIWGVCFLISLVTGGLLEGRVEKLTMARIGTWTAVAAFALIVASGTMESLVVFYGGVILLGLATGLSTVSNLSLMLDMTVVGSVGLFIGAWGMANAVARLVGNMMSGVVRDLVTGYTGSPVPGYQVVFVIELVMLLISLGLLRKVDVNLFRQDSAEELSFMERAALANEA